MQLGSLKTFQGRLQSMMTAYSSQTPQRRFNQTESSQRQRRSVRSHPNWTPAVYLCLSRLTVWVMTKGNGSWRMKRIRPRLLLRRTLKYSALTIGLPRLKLRSNKSSAKATPTRCGKRETCSNKLLPYWNCPKPRLATRPRHTPPCASLYSCKIRKIQSTFPSQPRSVATEAIKVYLKTPSIFFLFNSLFMKN